MSLEASFPNDQVGGDGDGGHGVAPGPPPAADETTMVMGAASTAAPMDSMYAAAGAAVGTADHDTIINNGSNNNYNNNNNLTTLVGAASPAASATATDGGGMVMCEPVEPAEAADNNLMDMAADTAGGGYGSGSSSGGMGDKQKKRLCKMPGCRSVIKSQGHCQRHGAKAKRCKVDGCDKQAQGTHDGMCKRHWKESHFPDQGIKKESQPPPPEGVSVYESILPASISYRPTVVNPIKSKVIAAGGGRREISVTTDALGELNAPAGINVMPLVVFLKDGRGREPGWHRNMERRARGLFPCSSLSMQLEPWERQLALVETLLLSGGTPHANFNHLAHAWGREKGFHTILTNIVCHRKGEVERKRRSDVGRVLTEEERDAFKKKMNQTKKLRRESMESEQLSQQQRQQQEQQQKQQQQQLQQQQQHNQHQQPQDYLQQMVPQDHQHQMMQFQQVMVQQPMVQLGQADAAAVAVAAAAAAAAGHVNPNPHEEDTGTI